MNPLEFSWKEDQQVTVTNPTDEPYKFRVHSKEYELGAHKSAKMPGYIAWVFVYGLASKLAQQDGVFNRWNEEDFRPTYYEKLVKGVDDQIQSVEEEPEPEVNTFDEEEEPDQTTDTVSTGPAGSTLVEDGPSDGPVEDRLSDPAPNTDREDSNPTPELQTDGATTPQVQPMTAKPRAKALNRSGRGTKVS